MPRSQARSRILTRRSLAVVLVAGSFPVLGLAAGPAFATTVARTITSSQLSLTFDGTDPERVTDLTWSPNGSTNYVAQGGGTCSGSADPVEFFGQSYGGPGNLVVQGQTGTWSSTGSTVTIASVGSAACGGSTVPVSTGYVIDDVPAYANEVQVTRTFHFPDQSTATGSLRAYVPRLPVNTYGTVLYPTASGVAATNTSGNGSPVAGWDASKGWFADDNGSGTGMLVLRDPTDTLTGQLLADSDSYSSSNNSDFAVQPPGGGWTGDQTETEYLCFYDPATWTQQEQAAGQLPTGCGAFTAKSQTATQSMSVDVAAGTLAISTAQPSVAFGTVAPGGSSGPINVGDIDYTNTLGDGSDWSATVAATDLTNGADAVPFTALTYHPGNALSNAAGGDPMTQPNASAFAGSDATPGTTYSSPVTLVSGTGATQGDFAQSGGTVTLQLPPDASVGSYAGTLQYTIVG